MFKSKYFVPVLVVLLVVLSGCTPVPADAPDTPWNRFRAQLWGKVDESTDADEPEVVIDGCETDEGAIIFYGDFVLVGNTKHYCTRDGWNPPFSVSSDPDPGNGAKDDFGNNDGNENPEPDVDDVDEPTVLAGYSGSATYTPPQGSMALQTDEGVTVGVSYVLTDGKDYDAITPAYSTSIFVGGNFIADGIQFTSDGTVGNIYMVLCREADGCRTRVSDYTAGHFSISTVFSALDMEHPNVTAARALNGLLTEAPNCGANYCLTATLTTSDDPETMLEFTEPLKESDLYIAAHDKAAEVLVLGVPTATVLEMGGKIIGRTWIMSGDDQSVSVPEGDDNGTVLICPNGCTVNGRTIEAGGVVVLIGFMTDGTTPDDLNLTAEVNGEDIMVALVFKGDVMDVWGLLAGNSDVTLMEPDGTIREISLDELMDD